MTVRVAAIGEAMVELSRDASDPGRARLGFAGDTFNSAIYIARSAPGRVKVDFVTRLGRDSFSDDLVEFATSEGVGTGLVGRSGTRSVGLYAITTDTHGERSFAYWRDRSAARTLFDEMPPALADLADFDLILFSAITLAILSPLAREALFDWLAGFRRSGGKVAFDSNFRPALWADTATARDAVSAAWTLTDIALPSVDDEIAIFGDPSADAVVRRLAGYGVRDGAMKCGPEGPRSLGEDVPGAVYATAGNVVDTTAAGDSFNGGYLAAKLTGLDQRASLLAGHDLAARVIQFPGAILPREAMPAPR